MTTETTSALMAQLQRERREIAQAWQVEEAEETLYVEIYEGA